MEDELISILDILNSIKKRWRLIACITLSTTLISVIYSFFLIAPIYSSSVKVFIGKSSNVKNEYSSNDLNLYKNLVKTYAEVIKTDDLLQKSIDNNNLDITVNHLKSGLSVYQEDEETQIMTIEYSSYSNYETKEVLDAVSKQFIESSTDLIPNGKAQIIQNAKFPEGPTNINNYKNIILGALSGILGGSCLIIVIEYFNNTFKNKEQVEKVINIPVIGTIPNEIYYK